MAAGEFGNTRQLPSGRWQARYRYRGQDYKAPDTFKTRKIAEGWLSQEKKLIDLDAWIPPQERLALQEKHQQEKELTVGRWISHYHKTLKIKTSTAQTYLRTITNRILAPVAPGDQVDDITRLKDIPLVELTKKDVYQWWDAIERTYDTPETNRKAYVRLKSACMEAVRRELIPANPVDIPATARTHRKETPYLPKTEELHKILTEVPARYRLITALILFHGLRIGEAIALEVDSVIKEGGRYGVRVCQNVQRITPEGGGKTFMLVQSPKSKAGNRVVPFMPEFAPVLEEHLAMYLSKPVEVQLSKELGGGTRPAQLLTTTGAGLMVMDTSYRSVLARAVERAGVSPLIKPHSGRRWLVTTLAEHGAHVKEISRILGDEDLDTIMSIYMQVRAERTTELMDIVSKSVARG